MRPSSRSMPRWWQAAWRRRYPAGPDAVLRLHTEEGPEYSIRAMGCGCGYTVRWITLPDPYGERGVYRIGPHRPTLGGAIRQARQHARAVS